MGRDMNGVVLWSNESQQKAVIWCEDQGVLAYYTHQHQGSLVSLHEGDLICFDMTLQQNKRMVENPLVLAQAACRGLAQSLSDGQAKSERKVTNRLKTAQVIPFSDIQKRRDDTARRM